VRGLETSWGRRRLRSLIVNNRRERQPRSVTLFEQMRARHVDGFVLATATLHDQLLAERAAAEVAACAE